MSELLDYVELMNGARLYLLPVTQIDLQIKRSEAEKEFAPRLIEQPWYWSVDPDEKGQGGEKTFWTKKDIEKDGSPEEREAWAIYERNQADLSNFIEDAVFKFLLIEGTSRLVTRSGNELDLVIDPITFEWQAPKAWLETLNGSKPDNLRELKFMYLSPMIRDAQTGRKIVSRCNLLSMRGIVTEEDLAKYDAIFQRAMAEAARAAGPEAQEPESGDEQGGETPLDVQLSETGTSGDETPGASSEPVGQPEQAG